MVIDEQKILYTVDSGNFFGRKRKTTNWAEAKELIKDLITKSKKKTAYLTVSYKDIPLGSFDITDASTIEKPRLEIGLEYKELLKKAITIKACACANNEISVFFIDKKRAEASGDLRKTSRMQTKTGDMLAYIGYTDKNNTHDHRS